MIFMDIPEFDEINFYHREDNDPDGNWREPGTVPFCSGRWCYEDIVEAIMEANQSLEEADDA